MFCKKKKNPEFYANSVDPDQMPLSVASDLGLYYLQIHVLFMGY